MANSTTMVTDLNTVLSNGPAAATTANAIAATALSATGAAGNMTGTTGVYGSGTFFGGIMDYTGNINLVKLKLQECAVLLAKVMVNTDHGTDSTNGDLIAKVLNNLQ